MKTGEPSPRTGLYRSDCACGSQALTKFGEIAPPCWQCRSHVAWTFLRSSFVPTTPSPDGGTPRARGSDGARHEEPPPSKAARPLGLLVTCEPGVAERAVRDLASASSPLLNLEHRTSLALALRALHERTYAVVVLDLVLPDSRGPGAVHRVHEVAPAVPVVVVTDREREPSSGIPKDAGVRAVIPRSRLDGPSLASTVRAVLGVPEPAAAPAPGREGQSRVA